MKTKDGNQKIMIEVKNVARDVDETEKKKFRDDLKVQKIKVGIFVSLKSNIVRCLAVDSEITNESQHQNCSRSPFRSLS